MLSMYAIFDRAVGKYMQPFFAMADGQAVRMFVDAINDSTTTLGKHPEDYSLNKIGVFDDASGTFASLEVPELVVRGTSVLRSAGGE